MKSGKKGFTIVEIVVALVIISIVAIATTSVVLSSQKIQKDTRDKFFAVSFCNNSVVVFQSAVKGQDLSKDAKEILTDSNGLNVSFANIMSNSLDIEQMEFISDDTSSNSTIFFDSNWKQTSKDTGSAKFECVFTFEILDGSNKTVNFNITINTISNDNELYSASYSYLGGAQ